MFDFSNYKSIRFVVRCETGILADSVNGHRVVKNIELNKYEYVNYPTKYVNKHTAEPIYTRIVEQHEDCLTFTVLKATTLNKHGLNWSVCYEAIIDKNGMLLENGEHNISFWIEGNGRFLTNKNFLVPLSAKTVTARECLDVLLDEPVAGWIFFKYDTVEKVIASWLNGSIKSDINKNSIPNQKFGVEIEFTGISRKHAAQVLAYYFKTSLNGDNYSKRYTVSDKKNRAWKIVSDASISPEVRFDSSNTDSDFYKCELVTPVLDCSDIETLQQIVRSIKKAGACVNSSCGIHVHVDGSKHTATSLLNLASIMNVTEDEIFKAINASPLRIDNYSRTMDPIFKVKIDLMDAKTTKVSDIRDAWYGDSDNIEAHYNATRYHALNLHSYFQGKGVEFRMFNSTLHAGKVKTYIQLCLAINSYSMLPLDKDIISTELFSDFESFATEIGLIGKEYETARYHLLKNELTNTNRRNIA